MIRQVWVSEIQEPPDNAMRPERQEATFPNDSTTKAAVAAKYVAIATIPGPPACAAERTARQKGTLDLRDNRLSIGARKASALRNVVRFTLGAWPNGSEARRAISFGLVTTTHQGLRSTVRRLSPRSLTQAAAGAGSSAFRRLEPGIDRVRRRAVRAARPDFNAPQPSYAGGGAS